MKIKVVRKLRFTDDTDDVFYVYVDKVLAGEVVTRDNGETFWSLRDGKFHYTPVETLQEAVGRILVGK